MTGWVAVLGCGHETRRLQHSPVVGGFVSCPEAGCRGQERVTAVRPVPPVYVQDALL